MNLTYILIIITAFVSFYGFSRAEVIKNFIFNPYVIDTRNQYYRFVTCALIHKDFTHLLFNMLAMYFFGVIVEEEFAYIFGNQGGVYYVGFYIVAVVVAGLPSYFKHRTNPSYNALGASGGVSAVLFASIIFYPTNGICFYFAICLPGFIVGALYLIYSYFMGKRGGDNIGHDAHLFGALFGVIFCIIMYPDALGEFWEQIKNWDGNFIQ